MHTMITSKNKHKICSNYCRTLTINNKIGEIEQKKKKCVLFRSKVEVLLHINIIKSIFTIVKKSFSKSAMNAR